VAQQAMVQERNIPKSLYNSAIDPLSIRLIQGFARLPLHKVTGKTSERINLLTNFKQVPNRVYLPFVVISFTVSRAR
jgi:hypothetical protein